MQMGMHDAALVGFLVVLALIVRSPVRTDEAWRGCAPSKKKVLRHIRVYPHYTHLALAGDLSVMACGC